MCIHGEEGSARASGKQHIVLRSRNEHGIVLIQSLIFIRARRHALGSLTHSCPPAAPRPHAAHRPAPAPVPSMSLATSGGSCSACAAAAPTFERDGTAGLARLDTGFEPLHKRLAEEERRAEAHGRRGAGAVTFPKVRGAQSALTRVTRSTGRLLTQCRLCEPCRLPASSIPTARATSNSPAACRTVRPNPLPRSTYVSCTPSSRRLASERNPTVVISP